MAVKTEILEKTNPEYISNIGDYNLYRQTYLVGSEYIEAGINLFRHGITMDGGSHFCASRRGNIFL
jgi:hypothetical protein